MDPAQGATTGHVAVLIDVQLIDVQNENTPKPHTQVARGEENFKRMQSNNKMTSRQMFIELLKISKCHANTRNISNVETEMCHNKRGLVQVRTTPTPHLRINYIPP